MYTTVVDELLDLQLEFEEKLAEVEEQASADLEQQKEELGQNHKQDTEEVVADLEKHKAAIAKLGDKLQKTTDALMKARATSGPAGGGSMVNSAELQKLQDKIDQLNEDLGEEKKLGLKTEDDFDRYKKRVAEQEDEYKEATMQLARIEIENDELKNDTRQMGFMVEDLEQKLDSQLEINELLNTEQEEMKAHSEEQLERLRQQVEDANSELLVKDKELKKLKFNQLMIDTQQTFAQLNVTNNLNNTVRHATSYAKNKAFDTEQKEKMNNIPVAADQEVNQTNPVD